MKPYNKENIPLAKKLRKNMTPWERKLWYEFLRYYPVRFQRQKAIGEYIADFYCAKARLVIELDGSGHYEPKQAAADNFRTEKLESMNLTVLRLCNLDVDRNLTGVCEYIDMFVKNSLPQSASLTAPSSEGAGEVAKTVYALGFFDGVHLGHQALLRQCRYLADQTECQSAVMTFRTHPAKLLKGEEPPRISTDDDRRALLFSYGIHTVEERPFDKITMQTPWEAFLANFPRPAGFVCGDDFRFGMGGEGTAEKLAQWCKEQNIPCVIVPQQEKDGIRVSSTHIRSLLEQGKMAEAVRFLGHPHRMTGTVIHGKNLGHKLGIPTANMAMPEGTVQLPKGVYACTAEVEGKRYAAVTNIGTQPTVDGTHLAVEAWLLDFEGDLYGKKLTLHFYDYLRPEKKFASLEELKAQIQTDAENTRQLLGCFCRGEQCSPAGGQ